MSKPQAKRRYRKRRSARKTLRRYPFLRQLPRVQGWMEDYLNSPDRKRILIAAGRRGGKTALMQEAMDKLRHVNWDGPSAWLNKPLAPLPPNTTFTDIERRTLREGQTVRFVPIVDGKRGETLYPCAWCGKLTPRRGACSDCISHLGQCAGRAGCGGSCVLTAGHAGQCECIGDTRGEPGTCGAC